MQWVRQKWNYSSPAGIYLLKVNNRNTRTKVWNMFKVNNKVTKTTSFIVNFEHILHLCSSVSTVKFEHVITCWVGKVVLEEGHLWKGRWKPNMYQWWNLFGVQRQVSKRNKLSKSFKKVSGIWRFLDQAIFYFVGLYGWHFLV